MKKAIIVGNQEQHHLLEPGTEVVVKSEPYVYQDRFMGEITVVDVEYLYEGTTFPLEQTIIEEDLEYV